MAEGLRIEEQKSVAVVVAAILLLGGNKTGVGRWYETHVPRAEKLFAVYLKESGQAE